MKIQGTIRSATDPKEFQGSLQIGFVLQESPQVWYNIPGTQEVLDKLRSGIIKKGNEISFEFNDFKITEVTLINEAKEPETQESEFKKELGNNIVNIKGKDYVTYAGLLKMAHIGGLKNIEILESWISEDMNRAWCKVRARFVKDDKEMFFDGLGSSTPDNTGEMTKTHPVEMANTRAKGRALRDFLNIGTAMFEELKNK